MKTGFSREQIGPCCVVPAGDPRLMEKTMDWNRIEGNWKQVKGMVKEQWGRLTDDDLDQIAGQREQLEGKIQERYGLAKDEVENEIDEWYNHQRWPSS